MAAPQFFEPHSAGHGPAVGPLSIETVGVSRTRPQGGTCRHAVERMQDAIRSWLAWNAAYEELTARMFQAAHDPARIEALAEEVDRMRRRAVAASRTLVE